MSCFCLLFFWPVFGHTDPAVTFLCTCHNSSTLAPRPLIIHPSPLTTQLQADCHGTDPLIHRSHGLMDFHSFIWVSTHSRNLIAPLSLSPSCFCYRLIEMLHAPPLSNTQSSMHWWRPDVWQAAGSVCSLMPAPACWCGVSRSSPYMAKMRPLWTLPRSNISF